MRLVAEANDLRNYRANSPEYSAKCAELTERIKSAFEPLNIEELAENQIKLVNSIKEILALEEQFARASFKIRSPYAWKDPLND